VKKRAKRETVNDSDVPWDVQVAGYDDKVVLFVSQTVVDLSKDEHGCLERDPDCRGELVALRNPFGRTGLGGRGILFNFG
jgi:hypothetical protein